MACRCSACTPKDTRGMWFLPLSRPPNFYEPMGQITTGASFFIFSKLSMLHHKKSSKMHTYLRIFAMSSFIKNTNKHVFLLQIVLLQNRCSYTITQFRPYALFQSKKHNKKRNKNNGIKYKRVQKSMPKSSFFVDFLFQILWKPIAFQHCFERVIKYEVLLSWLNCNLPFRSKKIAKIL